MVFGKRFLLILLFAGYAQQSCALAPAEAIKSFLQGTSSVIDDTYSAASGSITGFAVTNATLLALMALEMKLVYKKPLTKENIRKYLQDVKEYPLEHKLFLTFLSTLVLFDANVLVRQPLLLIDQEAKAKKDKDQEEKRRKFEADQALKLAQQAAALELRIDAEPEIKHLVLLNQKIVESAPEDAKDMAQATADVLIKQKREEFKKKYKEEAQLEQDRRLQELADEANVAKLQVESVNLLAQAEQANARAEQLKADAKLRDSRRHAMYAGIALDVVDGFLQKPAATTIIVN